MTWPLLLTLSVLTVASRVLPLAFLPTPTGYLERALQALPPPLFAGLAVFAVMGDDRSVDPAVLLAAAAAVAGSSRRSLAVTLACGLAGFAAGSALGLG